MCQHYPSIDGVRVPRLLYGTDYKELGPQNRFQHFVFKGGHEFDDKSAREFVLIHL